MWNCSRTRDPVTRRHGDTEIGFSPRPRVPVSPRLILLFLLLTAYCLLFSVCCRDMHDQPKAIAYRENSFYKYGTGSRPMVEVTAPRGYLRDDRAYCAGTKPKTS